MEDKWRMERRFIAHDKVDYVMIQICVLVLIAYENNIQKKLPNESSTNRQTYKETDQLTNPGHKIGVFGA